MNHWYLILFVFPGVSEQYLAKALKQRDNLSWETLLAKSLSFMKVRGTSELIKGINSPYSTKDTLSNLLIVLILWLSFLYQIDVLLSLHSLHIQHYLPYQPSQTARRIISEPVGNLLLENTLEIYYYNEKPNSWSKEWDLSMLIISNHHYFPHHPLADWRMLTILMTSSNEMISPESHEMEREKGKVFDDRYAMGSLYHLPSSWHDGCWQDTLNQGAGRR